MEKVSCSISEVYLHSEDTLFIDIKANKRFGSQDYFELKRTALKIGNGKSYYNIIQVGGSTFPNREAVKASCSVEGSYYKRADAFVIPAHFQRLIGAFFVRIHRPLVPTRFFKSVEEAENWLQRLKSKELVLNAI